MYICMYIDRYRYLPIFVNIIINIDSSFKTCKNNDIRQIMYVYMLAIY